MLEALIILESHPAKLYLMPGSVLRVTRHVVHGLNIERNIRSIAENVMKDVKRCLVPRIIIVVVWQREVPFRVWADEGVENQLCD